MQINKGTDVALRVLMRLAAQPDRLTTIDRLADDLAVPRNHLAKLVQVLGRAGWVTTMRGRRGGLTISPAGRAASIGDVLRVLEPGSLVTCDSFGCTQEVQDCRLRAVINHAHESFLAELDEVVIGEAPFTGTDTLSR